MRKFLTLILVFHIFSYALIAQLNGTYLIDQNGNGDYNSLTAAANALNSQGMNGNVILQLATDLYAEQVLFDIPGQSENELLTIESLSGVESDVVFRFEEATEEENYQLAFQDIKALSIRNISINTEGLDEGIGIDFKGGCSNVIIDNLHHIGNNNDEAVRAFYSPDFVTPPGIFDGFSVINSYFHKCSPSVSIGEFLFIEPESGLAQNLSFSNNEIFDADGINLNFAENVAFFNNIAYGDQYLVQPIKLQYCNGPISIYENRLWNTFNTIEATLCAGTENNPILFANNFISGREDLLKINSNTHLKFVYNAFYSDDNSQLGVISSNLETEFLNNIFYQNHPDGTIFLIYFVEDNSIFDYNDMYSNGSYALDFDGSATVHLTYEEYVSQTGRETNGINVQPIFTEPGVDLHTANESLNAGLPINEVTTDIDGETRSVSNPTIGADEIEGIVVINDLTIDTVITSGDLTSGDQLTIEWSGTNNGGTVFQAPWTDRVYLSNDESIDDLDIELDDFGVEDNLSPGADYERQIIVTIPIEIIGTKYIIVKVDANADLLEDNSNNIEVSAAFTVSPQALPNLVVTAIEMPENVFSGTTLQINFTVTNQGAAPASGNWTEIAWYESDIDEFNQGAYHLQNSPFAQANNIIGLMPGESYIGTVSAETPYIEQGWSYIRIETDAGDDIVEELDANDNFSDAIIDSVFINQSPLADLVIEDIQTPPESFAGEEIAISYTVLNAGTETTSPVELPYNFYFGWTWAPLLGDWVDYTYFSDTLFDFLPNQYEAVFTRNGNLDVDSSYNVVETVQIPECVNGPYFVTAYADRWNHVAELSESNNDAISDTILVITRPAPDLIPESDDLLVNMASNSQHTLSYKILNQGADTANTSWSDRVFLSDSSSFQYDIDEMVGIVSRNIILAPDAQVDLTINFDIPPEIYGEKYLYLWVDAINDICELPYDNNNILQFSVQITQSPAADLEISFIPPSDNLIAGDQYDLSGLISNIGEVYPDVDQWRDIIFILDEEGIADTVYKEIYDQNIQLAPEASYNLPDPFFFPLDIEPGFYSLGMMTDTKHIVWENESEQNNVVNSEPILISHDSSRVPDLIPIDISSENWESGQTYSIDVSVNNISAPTGIATWIDELYILNENGEKLATSTNIFSGNLDNDDSYSATIDLEIPLGTPANVFLGARIDTANDVMEYNTINNILEIPITVIPGLAPDLSPTDLMVPTEINAGQEMDLSVFRNNFGEVDVDNENWIDRVLLSLDNLPSNNDISLRSYAFTSGSMSSQSGELFSDSIQIPLTITGNYFLIYLMDANDDLNEGNFENNNYVVSDFPVQVLTPAPVDFASDLDNFNVTDGNLDNMNYSLTNTSTETFTGKFYNVYYLSTDSVYSLDDQFFGLDQVADYDAPGNRITIDPSETTNRFVSFIYRPVVAGEYYIIQKIDALLNVYETDESNNTIVFGPVYLDNVEEIYPDIVYDKQFGRNLPYPITLNGFLNPETFPLLGPDRHDFKIDIPDGFGMITHMWENEAANEAYGINNESQPIYEMYIGEGFVPTPLEFDFRFDSPLQADQYIIVPVAGDRTDYIKTTAPYIPPHFNPDSLPISQYHLLAEFKEFSVFDLTPEKVGTAHNVTLRITGFDLHDSLGLDVALIQQLDTVFAFETYPQNSSELIAYIDMRDHDAGEYELMVRKRTSGAYTVWEELVEVIDDPGPIYYSHISAPTETRLPNQFTIDVKYGNKGYSNEYDMGFYVAFFFIDTNGVETKTSAGINVEFLGSSITGVPLNDYISDEFNPAEVIDYGDMGYAIVYAARIPIMHAGFEESMTFKMSLTKSGILVTQSTLSMIKRSPYTFTGRSEDADSSYYAIMIGRAVAEAEGVLEELGGKGGGNCNQVLNADQMTLRIAESTKAVAEKAHGSTGFMGGIKKGLSDMFGSGNDLNKRYDGYKSLIDAKGELSLTADDDTPFASELTDVFSCIDYEATPTEGCWENRKWTKDGVTFNVEVYACDPGDKEVPPDKPNNGDRKETEVKKAADPNEIIGPAGESAARLIENEEIFLYTVYFENVPEATAPAVRVRVDNPLDSNLRLPSLRIVSFGFADTLYQFNNAPFVQQTVDLGSEFNGQQLNVIGGTNPASQKAFFEFTTIDPQTQAMATGANDGFLLPNDSTGRGQGFVTYIIEAKPDLDPGTIIKNKAAIIFDENEVIETNTWSNVIMGGALESQVVELPEFSDQEFELSWINETPPYGPVVESFDIYVRDLQDSTEWSRWLNKTESLSKQFTGTPGHTYEFFSRAISENGSETYKNSADATTTISEFKGDVSSSDPVLYPNPASEETQLSFNSSGSDIPMRIELSDSYGKKIYAISFTTTSAGTQTVDLSIRELSAGIYLVGIYENDELKGTTRLVATGNSKK